MRANFWMRMKRGAAISVVILIAVISPEAVRADVAPPAQPPGASISPGDEITRVRMLAETVTMNVLDKPAVGKLGTLKAAAVFTMNNTGSAEEKMQVRFPLTFWNGESDGFGHYPEIRNVQVKVNGKGVATHRIDYQPGGFGPALPPSAAAYDFVPWTAFDVTFPPGQDVNIEVDYTADGFGLIDYVSFGYVLETGAGWNGTIGSADIVVHLPYEANSQNIMFDEDTGFGATSPGGQISGNEIRWHFNDLEPTREDNIAVVLVTPEQWQKVLTEKANIATNSNDSEAWGRLGKAYKEMLGLKHSLRADEGGKAMYALSVQDYEKAVALAPNDPLWHYGFADLLWSHFNDQNYAMGFGGDEAELVRALHELSLSLELDPKNQKARDLADWISGQFPDGIQKTDAGYVFVGLTSTPVMLSPTPWASETPTATAAASATLAPKNAPTTSPPGSGGPPPCGGAILLMLAAFGLSKLR